MADQSSPKPWHWARLEETSQLTHQASELTELLSSACLDPKNCGKLLCPFPVVGAIIFRKLDKTLVEADEPGCHMLHFLIVCHPSSYGVVCLWVKIRSHVLKCQSFFKHCFCFQGSKQEMPSSVPQLVGTGVRDMQQKPGLAYGKHRNIFLDFSKRVQSVYCSFMRINTKIKKLINHFWRRHSVFLKVLWLCFRVIFLLLKWFIY